MFGRRGADAAVHREAAGRVLAALRRDVRRADVLETASEEQPAHDRALRFQPVGVELVAAVQARLGQEGEVFAAVLELADVEGAVGHGHETQRTVLHLDGLEAVGAALLVLDRARVGGLLEAAHMGQHIGTRAAHTGFIGFIGFIDAH